MMHASMNIGKQSSSKRNYLKISDWNKSYIYTTAIANKNKLIFIKIDKISNRREISLSP